MKKSEMTAADVKDKLNTAVKKATKANDLIVRLFEAHSDHLGLVEHELTFNYLERSLKTSSVKSKLAADTGMFDIDSYEAKEVQPETKPVKAVQSVVTKPDMPAADPADYSGFIDEDDDVPLPTVESKEPKVIEGRFVKSIRDAAKSGQIKKEPYQVKKSKEVSSDNSDHEISGVTFIEE